MADAVSSSVQSEQTKFLENSLKSVKDILTKLELENLEL